MVLGDIYEGEFKEDLMSGFGVMAFSNGDSYAGDWLDDAMHGAHGLYVKADGTTYEGGWKHDLRHGKSIDVLTVFLP